MTDVSASTDTSKPTARSRVTNGSSLYADVDGRTAPARRFRDVLDNLAAQFGATTESDLALVRRAAGLAVMIEQGEARLARGEEIDAGAQITAINAQRRVLADLAASQRARKRSRGAA